MSSRYLGKGAGSAMAAAAVRLRRLRGSAPFSSQEPLPLKQSPGRKRKLGKEHTGLTRLLGSDGERGRDGGEG